MSTVIINPLVVQIEERNTDVILPVNPTMHGGSVGRVIGTVAAVAVPFAAPAIASAVAASGALGAAMSAAMSTTVGGVISSAITGAALGGLAATVAGQPFSAGAVTGAITGGIGGYMSGTGTAAGGASGSTPPPSTLDMSATPTLESVASPDALAGLSRTGGTATGLTGGVAQGGATSSESLMNILSQTSEKVAGKLTNKDALANVTMQAASSLVGELLVPEGTLAQLSPEEQALIDERKAELEALRDRDLAAYNQAIEISKAYMVQANQIDPTYFAQQEANKAKVSSARTLRDIEEQSALDDKAFTTADRRRLSLDANRLSSSAYDTGFATGLDTRNRFIQAAQSTMPTAGGTAGYSQGLAGLQDVYQGQREAADKERENYQMMFAGLNTTLGNTKEEEEKKQKMYGQDGNLIGTLSYNT